MALEPSVDGGVRGFVVGDRDTGKRPARTGDDENHILPSRLQSSLPRVAAVRIPRTVCRRDSLGGLTPFGLEPLVALQRAPPQRGSHRFD
ncbi:hypothetical protein [Natrinema salinisoli]|uniref:hypothetical protein n=1 Tax=Natrinema salinisoli TaxID=2878535 RepID=UPI001CF007F6|nr:hypothetical protein [Natrinema salinisoli]